MSLFSTALRIYEAIYKGTDGLVGHTLLGVPTMLLRTTGAKSKLERTNALVYAEDGGRYLVVASKGGADTAPAWLHHLRANRDVGVQIGRRRKPATATVIDP